MKIYVDESIHPKLDFAVTAFVCAKNDIDPLVNSALTKAGLVPGVDEFKSGARMQGKPELQTLREDLYRLIMEKCRIAFLFTSVANRKYLGSEALAALENILIKNNISPEITSAYFDQGMFSSAQTAQKEKHTFTELSRIEFHPEQDSKTCLGIQLADAVANSMAQVVREEITGEPKFIDIGGENTGYPEGTEAELGWALLMRIRYSFFKRPVVHVNQKYDPRTNPLTYTDDDDPVDLSIHPELIGWGIHFGENVSPKVSEIVQQKLGRIWLGCIH